MEYNGAMENSINIYEEERPWGNFRRFTENSSSTVKILTVNQNKKLSLQSHENRSEFWRVIGGSGFFEIDKKRHEVKIGDEYSIPCGTLHRVEGGNNGLVVLEIATGLFDENDISRYEDDYGRV
jgi:mannose-1-phosphate guanylyltransferase/mannose-1-phosphate guanylyltransferase/mannose-6-phosphate isomerase